MVPRLCPPCGRIGLFYQKCEFPRCFNRLADTGLHNGPRDSARLRVFSIAFDNILEFFQTGPVDQTAYGSLPRISVHAHVQRAVHMKAEASFRRINLQG